MRLYVSCLLLAFVAALLIPTSASTQTGAECVAVYDANRMWVGNATQSVDSTTVLLNQDGRVIRLNAAISGVLWGGA